MKTLLWLGLIGTMMGTGLVACANPAAETYQKGIEGGEKAIDQARGVQQTVDQTKLNLEQQEKSTEGGTPSP